MIINYDEWDRKCPLCEQKLPNNKHATFKMAINQYYNVIVDCQVAGKSRMIGPFEEKS